MNPELIFWPMILLAFATIAIYPVMLRVRIAGVKAGRVKPRVYKLNDGEPEDSAKFNNAIKNQYETPILFYTVCLSAYVSAHVDWVFLTLACAYVAFKIIHIIVHTTSNWVPHRLMAFAASLATLGLMWIWFALNLAAIV